MERKISKLESFIIITTYSNSIGYDNNAEKHAKVLQSCVFNQDIFNHIM